MKAQCSRCGKRQEILFDADVRTHNSLKQLQLCPRCSKWALNFIFFSSPEGHQQFERVFSQVVDTAEFIKSNRVKHKETNQPVKPVAANEPF